MKTSGFTKFFGFAATVAMIPLAFALFGCGGESNPSGGGSGDGSDTIPYVPVAEEPETGWYANPDLMRYSISTAGQLAGLAQLVNDAENSVNFSGKTIVLESDLDLSGYNASAEFNGGKGWIPIGSGTATTFSGIFEGNGKTIRGLNINNPVDYVGLFGHVSGTGGTIKNLAVTDVTVQGKDNVGGLVGYLTGNGSRIVNCYVTGTVWGANHVGGIAGVIANQASVTQSYSTASAEATVANAGGIAGHTYHGIVSSCYATGPITSVNRAGGLVGYAQYYSNVTNSAALNPRIRESQNVGRVIGGHQTGGSITNNIAFGEMFGAFTENEMLNGEAISKEEIAVGGTFGDRFRPVDDWTVVAGKLPGLMGGTVDIPDHLR